MGAVALYEGVNWKLNEVCNRYSVHKEALANAIMALVLSDEEEIEKVVSMIELLHLKGVESQSK